MTLFKLVIDETLSEGEILIDKKLGIVLIRNMDDWFNIMKEYDNE